MCPTSSSSSSFDASFTSTSSTMSSSTANSALGQFFWHTFPAGIQLDDGEGTGNDPNEKTTTTTTTTTTVPAKEEEDILPIHHCILNVDIVIQVDNAASSQSPPTDPMLASSKQRGDRRSRGKRYRQRPRRSLQEPKQPQPQQHEGPPTLGCLNRWESSPPSQSSLVIAAAAAAAIPPAPSLSPSQDMDKTFPPYRRSFTYPMDSPTSTPRSPFHHQRQNSAEVMSSLYAPPKRPQRRASDNRLVIPEDVHFQLELLDMEVQGDGCGDSDTDEDTISFHSEDFCYPNFHPSFSE